jgi:hypothetical protein
MKTILPLILAVFCLGQACAKPDTFVTILEAEKVEVRADQVIITARATVKSRLVDSGEPGKFLGRSAAMVELFAPAATLIIHKMSVNSVNWKGVGNEHKEKYRIIYEESWQRTLAAAKALKAGKQVRPISFYQPKIVIEKSMVSKIEGRGGFSPLDQE